MQFDTDVFILGGGPAGLAAAVAARRVGLKVMLADARTPPIEKVCGEGLMPNSLEAVGKLGIELPHQNGYRFRGIRFAGPHNTVEADFPEGPGLGIRRTVLHEALVDHAGRAGVELLWNCSVSSLEDHAVRVGQRTIAARWIVGADGAQSSVRRWAGLGEVRRECLRFSYRRHYRMEPWSDYVEVHWGDGCQFYVTPVSKAEVCVVVVSREPQFRLDRALPLFPELAARLRKGEMLGSERGALGATRYLRAVSRGCVALVGDASGSVDPVTGDGLCLAFQQAAALAEAFRSGDLPFYEQAHRSIARRPRFMADFMLMLDRFPGLRVRALTALEARPELFANLLAMHVGQLGARKMAGTAAMLGWKVATA